MDAVLQSLAAGFPYFIAHFAVTVAVWAVGVAIYCASTPYSEIKLVREGNMAGAVTLGGAMLGLALPMSVALASSVSALDIVVWGAVALVVQILVYRVIDLLMRELPKRIEAGELGPALVLSAAKLSIALINAAAIAG